MGTLAYRPDGPFHALELEREFIATGHELSPLNLPLDSFSRGPRVFRPGDSPFDGGLPGLIADSLPDSWGARMLKVEVPGLQTTLGKLAAIGERGPGGITFEPVLGKGADDESVSTNLAGLARDAVTMHAGIAAYAIAGSGFIYSWGVVYPYMMGIAISLDPSARIVGYALALQTVGKSVGPALAASLVVGTNYTGVYWLCFGLFLASMICFLPAIFSTDKVLKAGRQ